MFLPRRSLALIVSILVLVGLAITAGAFAWVQHNHWSDPAYGMKLGEAAIEKKQWKEVDHIANRLEAARFYGYAELLRGKRWIAKDDAVQAIRAFEKIDDSDPAKDESRLLQAECEFAEFNYDRSAALLEVLIAKTPDNGDLHFRVAFVFYRMFAFEDSERESKEAARLDDRDGRPHGLMGLLYKDQKAYGKAVASYRAALERKLSDQRRNEVLEELAESLVENHEIEPALKAIDDMPASGDPLLRAVLKSRCELEQKKPKTAQETLEQALSQVAVQDVQDLQRVYPARLLWCRSLLENKENKDTEHAVELLKRLQKDHGDDLELAKLLQQGNRKLKIEDSAVDQHVADLEKAYLEMDKLQHKAYADPSDKVSRRAMASKWVQLGRNDKVELWKNAAKENEH
jgi:hypothetical protein